MGRSRIDRILLLSGSTLATSGMRTPGIVVVCGACQNMGAVSDSLDVGRRERSHKTHPDYATRRINSVTSASVVCSKFSTPESRQCLRHCIHLVIVSARWEGLMTHRFLSSGSAGDFCSSGGHGTNVFLLREVFCRAAGRARRDGCMPELLSGGGHTRAHLTRGKTSHKPDAASFFPRARSGLNP